MGTCPRAHGRQRRAVPTGPCSGHLTSSYQALGSHLPQSPTSHHAAQHPFNHNRARTSKQKLSMAKNVQPQTAFSPFTWPITLQPSRAPHTQILRSSLHGLNTQEKSLPHQ